MAKHGESPSRSSIARSVRVAEFGSLPAMLGAAPGSLHVNRASYDPARCRFAILDR